MQHSAGSSLLLIALAAAVAVLAAHVALGWLREAQRTTGSLGSRAPALALAAFSLGSGLPAASVLVLAGEALSFPIGYRTTAALSLWTAAVGGSALIGLVLLSSTRWWAVTCAGFLLGGMAMGVHLGWVAAAGFRPGVAWEPVFLVAAAVLLTIGSCSGLWLGWSDSAAASTRSGAGRLGAAVLIGLAVVTGMQVLDSGLSLPSQAGSVYSGQLAGGLVTVLGGVLLPLVLSVLAIDLHARRRQRRDKRRQPVNTLPQRVRRRRHKMPTL